MRSEPVADTFEALVEPHRQELHVHCYRMTGSLADADDLVQETMLRAWRGFERFEGRASVRTWLYRIATNAALDSLASKDRRVLPWSVVPASDPKAPAPALAGEPAWLEPYPDALLNAADPEEAYLRRETLRIAFLAAIQLLPPRQRAALLLRDVLSFDAKEAAEMLGTTTASVNSALQRARTTLAESAPSDAPPSAEEQSLVERYVRAFESADAAALTALLREDVEMAMPPDPAWFSGRASVAAFLASVLDARGPLTLVPVALNRDPGVAMYARDGDDLVAIAVQVLEIDGDSIARIVGFVGDELFPRLGLETRKSRGV